MVFQNAAGFPTGRAIMIHVVYMSQLKRKSSGSILNCLYWVTKVTDSVACRPMHWRTQKDIPSISKSLFNNAVTTLTLNFFAILIALRIDQFLWSNRQRVFFHTELWMKSLNSGDNFTLTNVSPAFTYKTGQVGCNYFLSTGEYTYQWTGTSRTQYEKALCTI